MYGIVYGCSLCNSFKFFWRFHVFSSYDFEREKEPSTSVSLENRILHSNTAWEAKTNFKVKAVVLSMRKKVSLALKLHKSKQMLEAVVCVALESG